MIAVAVFVRTTSSFSPHYKAWSIKSFFNKMSIPLSLLTFYFFLHNFIHESTSIYWSQANSTDGAAAISFLAAEISFRLSVPLVENLPLFLPLEGAEIDEATFDTLSWLE